MNLVVDSELLQPYQAVKIVFVHCTWYRWCIWTHHIIFNQIHDVKFLALFEPFACFPNNVRRRCPAAPSILPKTGQLPTLPTRQLRPCTCLALRQTVVRKYAYWKVRSSRLKFGWIMKEINFEEIFDSYLVCYKIFWDLTC